MKNPQKCSRWISICVDMLDHPVVGVRKGEPFSRSEAWVWLIANAAIDAKQVKHKKEILLLERGQLLGGRSFLAKTWSWSEKKVRFFIDRLAKEGAISLGHHKGQGKGQLANLVTICNYDTYQHKKMAKGQGRGQHKGQVQGPQYIQKKINTYTPLPPKGEREVITSVEKPADHKGRNAWGQVLNGHEDARWDGSKLEVLNGFRAELRDQVLKSTDDDLNLVLIEIAGGAVPASTPPQMLPQKIMSAVARIARMRRDNLAARGATARSVQPQKPKLKIDELPPTTDPAEVKRRYEMFLDEKPQYRGEYDRWWPAFQETQARKAREAGLIR